MALDANTRAPQPNTGGLHSFAKTPQADIHRSHFDLSHHHSTTFDAGYLIPVLSYMDVLPGDTFKVASSVICRVLDPLFKPIMDELTLDLHYFFVPHRLVHDHFVNMMGERESPADSINFTVPQLTSPTGFFAVGSLFDYMGYPVAASYNTTTTVTVDTYELRAYNLTWHTWYRDQNLIDAPVLRKTDSGDLVSDFPLQRRGKRHDYFTTCLPLPQKGDAVTIPMGSTAPIIGTFVPPHTGGMAGQGEVFFRNPQDFNDYPLHFGDTSGFADWAGYTPSPFVSGNASAWLDVSTVFADLSTATQVTINAFRQAAAVQQLLERDMRSGTRYPEVIHAHFGVISPDARQQRPEFLGSMSTPVQVIGVPQTAPGGNQPASLSAYSLAVHHGPVDFIHSFTEHGTLLGLASVRSNYSYQQGLPRRVSRQTRYDFYWPTFAMLGEQAVLMKEIFCDGSSNDSLVFGWQERWAEYRYFPSMITGLLRSQVAGTLDIWTLAQVFDNTLGLNKAFIEENPPVDRVVAVETVAHFVADFDFHISAVRPLPVFSVPGLTRI